ncbi:uncharacterized protein C8Q71DRAFT_724657 [Rhodofomes roseus]|uniref:Uncharacterized protein n=1 Tax=Rhodofomes roseus TaxID=34475 RepID=A0ABQ8KCL3_9APHY|nr:uncharacterized protein C8Q71DRAFT_724657 [Rhodofomes roseus]KAH9835336.1 hypothetical protein C8Q71DRAFT_724657 [Rhodofomes roseus]
MAMVVGRSFGVDLLRLLFHVSASKPLNSAMVLAIGSFSVEQAVTTGQQHSQNTGEISTSKREGGSVTVDSNLRGVITHLQKVRHSKNTDILKQDLSMGFCLQVTAVGVGGSALNFDHFKTFSSRINISIVKMSPRRYTHKNAREANSRVGGRKRSCQLVARHTAFERDVYWEFEAILVEHSDVTSCGLLRWW